MILIEDLNEGVKEKILKVLYEDEIHNAILIERIEKYSEDLGELYIGETLDNITYVLHIKNDGNSDFVNFAYLEDKGLERIANTIDELRKRYNKILLAGKLDDVKAIFNILGIKREVNHAIFYTLDLNNYKAMEARTLVKKAGETEKEIELVRDFTLKFLEAETEEEIRAIGDRDKILGKIRNGLYLLEYEQRVIGMARFIGETKNFSEITSVYIEPEYRNKGFGKELISHMINISLEKGKCPVLETGEDSMIARKTYEAMGFVRETNYSFEFV